MRLGGPVFGDLSDPGRWVAALATAGYGAAYCPFEDGADEAAVDEYREAARVANIVISEVGAWSNPLSRDEKTRREALSLCQRRLDLAERIGARCCVNIAGSRGEATGTAEGRRLISPELFGSLLNLVGLEAGGANRSKLKGLS